MIPFIVGALAIFGILLPNSSGAKDAEFLHNLDQHNITYQSPAWAIWDAHEVCNALYIGHSVDDVVRELLRQTELDPWHAGYFVGVSIATYCPEEG